MKISRQAVGNDMQSPRQVLRVIASSVSIADVMYSFALSLKAFALASVNLKCHMIPGWEQKPHIPASEESENGVMKLGLRNTTRLN